LQEFFVLAKITLTPVYHYQAGLQNPEQSVAWYQAATNEHWGGGCSALMKALSVYAFDRHFQIARSTASRNDVFHTIPIEWHIAEKTGNIEDCAAMNERKYRAMGSYIRASPSPGNELGFFVFGRNAFVGIESHHAHLQPRQNIARLLAYAGMANVQEAEECWRSSAECRLLRAFLRSSSDGLYHSFHEHAMVGLMRGALTLATQSTGTSTVDASWLDDLPPADASTLHCMNLFAIFPTSTRVLIAEVFEQQGRHTDAIEWAQAELQIPHNFNVASKVRAGRVLGRCHSAMGQLVLSVTVFDAAIELAKCGKLLLSEALAVRGRALAGHQCMGDAAGSGLHWDNESGNQRMAEVLGRMQGGQESLERAFHLP
jgi:hypothetical protein